MSDTNFNQRVEPVVGAGIVHQPVLVTPDVMPAAPAHTAPALTPVERLGGGSDSGQLMRIEEKTSRIEEKYARSEALLSRVEDRVSASAARTAELASGADLAAMHGIVAELQARVRRLPGFGALFFLSLLTAALSAGAFVALLRYVPNILPGIVR